MLAAAVLAAAVLTPTVALAVTDAERVAGYRDFRAAFDARRHPDALPLAEKLVALTQGQDGEADREFQYAVRVAQSAWGSTDRRVIRPVDRYAHWLEHMGRYPSARAAYARELTIAEGAGSRAARLVIDPLLGIARSYRLEATNGSDEETAQYVDPFAQSSLSGLPERAGRGLNPDGEEAPPLAQQANHKLRPGGP